MVISREPPFSHPSSNRCGKGVRRPRTTHQSGLLWYLQASRRIQVHANGRRVSHLAGMSLDESHSIIWGNSGAEPAALFTATHEAHSSRRLEYKAMAAHGQPPSMTNSVRRRSVYDPHCSRLLRAFACDVPLSSGACLPHSDA